MKYKFRQYICNYIKFKTGKLKFIHLAPKTIS